MSNLTFALPIGEQQDKVIQYARAHQGMEFPELAIEKKCVCPVDTCCQEFRGSSQLTMHILRRHDGCKLPVKVGQSSEHYCPVEGCHRAQGNSQPFPRLSQLKQHYHSVHGTKEYCCERCGRSFGLKDVCNRHQAECGTRMQCVTCKETFRSKNALYQHAKRKSHQLPLGSKPRAGSNRGSKKSSNANSHMNGIILYPIIVNQVPEMSNQSTSTQTDPEPTPIATASQTTDFTKQIDASTQLIGPISPNLTLTSEDASTCTSTSSFVDPSTQPFGLDSLSPMYQALDASTNTAMLEYPITYSSFEQLIDASTNTLPQSWADPMSRVDTGTSTISSSVCTGDTVELATQTNLEEFATLVDLATQTELPQIDLESHDFNVACEYTSGDFSAQSHDYTSCFVTHDFAGGPDFGSFDFSESHSHTRDISTSTNVSTSEYGVQTSAELDEISQLLSGYGQDFGTQTIDQSSLVDLANIPELSDFSTQTGAGTDSFTQTSILSESATQTLLGYQFMTNFGTKT